MNICFKIVKMVNFTLFNFSSLKTKNVHWAPRFCRSRSGHYGVSELVLRTLAFSSSFSCLCGKREKTLHWGAALRLTAQPKKQHTVGARETSSLPASSDSRTGVKSLGMKRMRRCGPCQGPINHHLHLPVNQDEYSFFVCRVDLPGG